MTSEGIIPKKRRAQFNRFLSHENPRVRSAALEMLQENQTNLDTERANALLEAYFSFEKTGDANFDFDLAAEVSTDEVFWLLGETPR